MKKTFELINKNYDRVIVKDNANHGQLMELSIELNHDTLKIEKINYRLMMSINDSLARWESEERASWYVSIESLNAAKKLLKRNVKELKVKLNDALTNSAYIAMKDYADDIIKHYKADFTFHDAIQLADHSSNDRFIWIVRTCGSHLFYNPSEWATAVFNQQKKSNEINQCFKWDGSRLIHITLEEGQQELNKMNQ